MGKICADLDIFTRGGRVFIPSESGDGLQVVTPEFFRTWIEKYVICAKVVNMKIGDTEQTVRIGRTMSVTDANGVLCAIQFTSQLKEIEKVNPIRMPVKDRDGYLKLLYPGYDEFTRTFTLESDVVVSEVMPLEMAKQILDELLAEFPFADGGRSKAVALSAMLTVFAHGILPRGSIRPCFIYLANAEGAGKTLLVKVAIVPVLGFSPNGSKAKDEDEMRKLLLAAVLEAKTVLVLDNFKGHLASESLEGFLTSQTWAGRVLGGSTTFTGENNATVFITGNGCTVSPDMRRRSLFVELFMDAERAEDRVFNQQLEVNQIVEMRGDILSALYALIRDWHKAMEPKPSRGNSSFHEWSNAIGGIVELAGYGCPLATAQIENAVDVELEDMRSLTKILGEGSSYKVFKFSEIVPVAHEHGLFEWILPEHGDMDSKSKSSFSKLIVKYDGRLIGQFRWKVSGKGHKRQYELTKVTSE